MIGQQERILPYFINHAGCPHQCVFCNQRVINGFEQAPLADFEAFLTKFTTQQAQALPHPRPHQLAFFGGSFTALPFPLMVAYLERAKAKVDQGLLTGIRISTRPDALGSKVLAALKFYGVQAVELGVQSLDDAVLATALRGHNAEAVAEASQSLLAEGFELGHQLMLGLPGQTGESFRATVKASIAMSPHTVRLYPVQVLKDTPLAEAYTQGHYRPWTLEMALDHTVWAVQTYRTAGVRVIKIGLQAHEALMDPDVRLAGPYHPAYGEWVEGLIVQRRIQAGLEALLEHRASVARPRCIRVHCHPRACSQVAGLSKGNREWLEHTWQMEMEIVGDRRLGPNELLLEVGSVLLALPEAIA